MQIKKIDYYWNKFLEFFGFDEDINQKEIKNEKHNYSNNINNNSKIVSLKKNKRKKERELNLIFYHPESYNEVKKIVDDLKSGNPVILNLEQIDNKQARRLIDFISGAIYGLNGNVKKIASNVFLFTPKNIKIDGEKLNKVIKNKFVQ